jgi:DNA-3-methyladenine glycosylase
MIAESNDDLSLRKIAGKKLTKEFYLQGVLTVAKQLIGKILVRKFNSKLLAGIIVETEAYQGSKDPASHAYRGKTKRNEAMFESGGVCYVYFTYGNHYCMNVVTQPQGTANAVLIRALEPIVGLDVMKKNRGLDNIYNLASGPGKLTQALGIDKRLNGVSLRSDELFLAEPVNLPEFKILRSKRIGITKNPDKLWRFYAANNPYVSRVNVKSILKRINK